MSKKCFTFWLKGPSFLNALVMCKTCKAMHMASTDHKFFDEEDERELTHFLIYP